MSRIKGRYVAQVVLEFDVPREYGMDSLEDIRHSICDGDLTNAIKDSLSSDIDRCSITVDQQFADVYEVDNDGTDCSLKEIPLGHWTDKGSLSCRCSECGCKSPKEYPYCPNCGTPMEK